MPADVIMQRAPALVAHDQINRAVGAEKICHANKIGMIQPRHGAAFFKKAFEAMVKGGLMLRLNNRHDRIRSTQRQTIRQILFNRYRRTLGIVRQIDNRKPAV